MNARGIIQYRQRRASHFDIAHGFDRYILPERFLNSQVWQELETIEEKEKMEYVTSIERLGMVKGQSSLLKRQLERRFGLLPEWASEKLKSAKSKDLEAWADAILTAPTLEAVFKKSDVP